MDNIENQFTYFILTQTTKLIQYFNHIVKKLQLCAEGIQMFKVRDVYKEELSESWVRANK